MKKIRIEDIECGDILFLKHEGMASLCVIAASPPYDGKINIKLVRGRLILIAMAALDDVEPACPECGECGECEDSLGVDSSHLQTSTRFACANGHTWELERADW